MALTVLNGLLDAFRRSRSKAMQVALTLFFSLSSIAVPTLIGDEAFGNLILTVAGYHLGAGYLVCVFCPPRESNGFVLVLAIYIYYNYIYIYIN